jgi:hypothetical protein
MKAFLVVTSLVLLVGGCGGEEPKTLASPNGSIAVTYRLRAAEDPFLDPDTSALLFRPPGTARPPIFESLRGTFDAVTGASSPDTIFRLEITRVSFASQTFTIEAAGDVGSISARTLNLADPISGQLRVSIDSRAVALTCSGSRDTFTSEFPPTFRGIRCLGEGYSLSIFATPAALAGR